ncbi:lipopolysaccharide biosynthesis protein [Spirochaeta cellobiosiphila]|uniref:lipopolysaccharide biosynthesis protein n=1 Tax=Spirochaeta cellobiosiphila TaxID=504483 RepID=UPI00048C854E|nr:oligosaccharide flippase family protein [Spirochaeta cellobiosiphila]
MTDRRFILNFTSNILSFIINIGVSLLLTPYLINKLGSVAYGFFPLSTSFIQYFNIVAIALNSMGARFITIAVFENKIEKAEEYYSSIFFSNIILSIIFGVVSFLFVINISKILDVPYDIVNQVKLLFGLVFIGISINLITTVLNIGAYVYNRLDYDAFSKIIGNIIKIIVLMITFVFYEAQIWYLGLANLFQNMGMVVYNYRISKKFPNLKASRGKFSLSSIKILLFSGVWNSINQLSNVILTSLDLLFANIFISAQEAGEYSVAKIIPLFIQSLTGILVNLFVPKFTKLYAEKNIVEFDNEVKKSLNFLSFILCIPIGFLLIFGKDFFNIWVPNENTQKLYILSTLTLLPLIFSTAMNTLFNIFTVTNKIKLPSIILFASGILKFLFIALIIKYVDSIIIIPLVSFIVVTVRNLVFTPIYAAKCMGQKLFHYYKFIISGISFYISSICVSYLARLVYKPNSLVEIILIGVIVTFIIVVVNFLLMIIFNREILTNIKRKLIN